MTRHPTVFTAAALGALLLMAAPPPASAETITLDCPSSVVEGGLVAQAVNCPSPDLPIGHPYCEYRDEPGQNNSRNAFVGPNPRETYYFGIDDADGGYYFVEYVNLLGYSGSSATSAVKGFAFPLEYES